MHKVPQSFDELPPQKLVATPVRLWDTTFHFRGPLAELRDAENGRAGVFHKIILVTEASRDMMSRGLT